MARERGLTCRSFAMAVSEAFSDGYPGLFENVALDATYHPYLDTSCEFTKKGSSAELKKYLWYGGPLF